MTTENQVLKVLETITVPSTTRNLVAFNLIRKIETKNGNVDIVLASTGLNEGAQGWIKSKIEAAAKDIPEIKKTAVSFEAIEPKELNKIERIIAVTSGKGGVGKSLVSGLIAISLRRKGFNVGILDADITGPSIPKMFNLNTKPAGNEQGILPVTSSSGIVVISMNLLLPEEEDAIIWRGPLIGKAITQFGEEVVWGKLDYLVIDLPPGTSDAPLTVMQSFPITGVVVVFTPQNLVEMIVRKAVNMARKMDKRVIGVVENMSYLYLPELDKRIEIFGKSRGQEMADAVRAPLLAKIPIDPELATLCDVGQIEKFESNIVDKLGDLVNELATS